MCAVCCDASHCCPCNIDLVGNTAAGSPGGSLSHSILLDNLSDAVYVRHGVKNFSGSIATCLQSIAQPMPDDSSVVPGMDICTTVKALSKHLGGTYDYVLHFACTDHDWISLVASVGSFVSHLFLVDVCSAFCSPGLIVSRFAGGQHVARVRRHCGDVTVADEMHMIFECPALRPPRQQYAPLCSTDTNTIRCFVLRNKITCILSSLSEFDPWLLLHVI